MQDDARVNADPARPSARRFAVAALQLGLLVLVVRLFELEAPLGLVALMPVLFACFCVHAWLPARWKGPCFLVASLTAAVVVLGPAPATVLVAIALGLFGLCELPVPIPLRGLLLALAGAALAALLVGVIESSWAGRVVSVVAAMFMFRSAVYLYDRNAERKTGRAAAPLWMRMAYFFLLPNVCFLLFPVVDYRTFERGYYAEQSDRLHARGLQWMLRGIVHLLLYRAVYAYLTPVEAEVQDLGGVVLFVVSSYLLYLRISGHFHLIVGMLHLFGFQLPETNHDYLFASSFTDTWRRINVYWTEFMKKIVYFPVFVRARRRGLVGGMVAATTATFLATWLLHAYQWFWLNGEWPAAMDGLFWGVAGALALANMLLEARSSGTALRREAPSWGGALRRSLQALGIFTLICTTWSLWCSASFGDWVATLSRARHAPASQVAGLAAAVLAILAAGTIGQRIAAREGSRRALERARGPVATLACTLGLLVLGQPGIGEVLGEPAALALAPIRRDTLNERDQRRLVASYYDRLIDREGFGGRVSERKRVDPDDPEVFLESDVAKETGGPLRYELPPSRRETFQDVVVETNSHGMRDREYALEKPPDTFRIAILGACYEMGSGVSNDDVWEAVAERRLNRELSPETGRTYEILNFSVAGYDLMQLVTVVREKVPPFEPDLVVVSNHVRSSVDFVLKRTEDESEWPDGLAEMVAVTRLETGVKWEERLENWAFEQITASCREFGATPALLNVPILEALLGMVNDTIQVRIDDQASRAAERGFVFLDLGGAFDGLAHEDVAIPQLARSPSANGHRILADAFYEALLAQPDGLGAL